MPNTFTADDENFMQMALRLASRGRGEVEPNPMVGAVVVKHGRVVGKGYHRRYGGPHAEVHALADAGGRARGATLYVTLEPCCHFGKTPPCTDAILRAGVARVVAAMIDPFAQVRGRGAALLQRRGLRVQTGLMEHAAQALNGPFLKRVKTGLPWVIAKWAQTLDGCVATASGESQWISSEESRAVVQTLRGRMDAIVVGIQTALTDDPLLMARPARGRNIHRIATRIVLDSRCRLPVDAQLVRTISFAPLMVVHARKLDRAAEARRSKLESRGVMTVAVPCGSDGRVSLRALLRYLGRLEYTNVLVEGGAEVLGSLVRQRLVDEAQVFIAPRIIGGAGAKHAIGGGELRRLADAAALRIDSVKQVGPDLHVIALPLHGQK